MAKKTVAIIMGGPSREHYVSLDSGQAVIDNLANDKYVVYKVVISLSGQWSIDGIVQKSSVGALQELKSKQVDLAFLAVHGSFGEDGTVQALLEKYGIAYNGSRIASSLLIMNKTISGEIFAAEGLKVPQTMTFTRYELVKDPAIINKAGKFDFPLIVKPASQGSSVGVTVVETQADLLPAIEFALEHDNQIIVQQFIKGREVSCAVIEGDGNSALQALPPTEIIPKSADFFDYYAKYTKDATQETTPPEMPQSTIKSIQEIAVKAHKILDCRGYSRTDMIVQGKSIFIIETNTLPGLTSTSILPQQAAAAGISFAELLDKIITSALRKAV